MSKSRIEPEKIVPENSMWSFIRSLHEALDSIESDYLSLMQRISSRDIDIDTNQGLIDELVPFVKLQRDGADLLNDPSDANLVDPAQLNELQERLTSIETGLSIAKHRINLAKQASILINSYDNSSEAVINQARNDVQATITDIAKLKTNNADMRALINDTLAFAHVIQSDVNEIEGISLDRRDPAMPIGSDASAPVANNTPGAGAAVPPGAGAAVPPGAGAAVPPGAGAAVPPGAGAAVPPGAGAAPAGGAPAVPAIADITAYENTAREAADEATAAANDARTAADDMYDATNGNDFIAASHRVTAAAKAARIALDKANTARDAVVAIAAHDPRATAAAANATQAANTAAAAAHDAEDEANNARAERHIFNAPEEAEGFFAKRKQNKSYSQMLKKFARIQTLQKLISSKKERFEYEAVKLKEIRTWQTMSDELLKNLKSYRNGLTAALAHRNNPGANSHKAYFDAWNNMRTDQIQNQINQISDMIKDLKRANLVFNELSTNIITENRLNFSEETKVIKNLADLTPNEQNTYKQILVTMNKLDPNIAATHVLTKEEYIQAMIYEHQNRHGQNNAAINGARMQAHAAQPAYRDDKQADKQHVLCYTIIDNVSIPVTAVEERRGDAYIHAITANMDAIQNTSKDAEDEIRRTAIKMVEDFRANSKDRLQLRGNWSPKLALAIISYCLYKGYECKASTNTFSQFTRNIDLRKMEKFCKTQLDIFDHTLENSGSKEINKLAKDAQITQPYKKGKLPF